MDANILKYQFNEELRRYNQLKLRYDLIRNKNLDQAMSMAKRLMVKGEALVALKEKIKSIESQVSK